jgi:hypothetical protein
LACENLAEEVMKVLGGPMPPLINTPESVSSWIGLATAGVFALILALAAFSAWLRFRARPSSKAEEPELRKAA